MGSGASLHGSNPERSMSALGQKQTFERLRLMSALPPKADIAERDWHVRYVAKADIVRCGEIRRYSITSSAVESSFVGTVRPIALAVSTLMASANLLTCCTGKSAGLSPLRMRPT